MVKAGETNKNTTSQKEGSLFLKCVVSVWVNFPRTRKMVKMWHYLIFLSPAAKNVFVLILAHLESELDSTAWN